MSKVVPQNINSTFVVLNEICNAISIAVSDRCYEKLKQRGI
jgi:hypothetical protein